jgi:23S rRNA (cytosine1962-C5)-methyltransferase
MALKVLDHDGILVTCSCSGQVSREDFAGILGLVAEHSGRSIQIIEQRGQASDHPVTAACPETNYLKCFICRVA